MTATITFRGGSLRLQHRPLRAATPGRTVSNNRCVAYLKDDDQGRPAPVVVRSHRRSEATSPFRGHIPGQTQTQSPLLSLLLR